MFRLAATLKMEERLELSEGIKDDLERFVKLMYETSPDIKSILKIMGIISVITIWQSKSYTEKSIYSISTP